MRTSSFDVFETLLFRAVGEPSAVFLLLGRRLWSSDQIAVEPAMFAAARIDAEQRARHRRPGIDTTLELIYRELASSLRLSEERAEAIAAAELELEDQLLGCPLSSNAAVDAARRRGDRIVFVSDTYLPEAFIRGVLASRGLLHPGDGLYVSSHRGGANKRSGALFTEMLVAESVAPDTITHVGNHPIADVERARSAGLSAVYRAQGNLRDDELILEQHRVATGGLSSVLAGASRLARLSQLAASGRDAVIRDVAAGIAGPTLVAFALWVLREADRRGLSRLYFLAREGQILLEVARRLAPKLGLDVELRYLYVSRQSLNAAALREISSAELAWTLTNVETNTVRTILDRVGMDPREVSGELAALGIDPDGWDAVPDAARRDSLLRSLLEGPLRPALEDGLEEVRTRAVHYLRQEGVLDPEAIGLVDTTGAGSQLRAVARLRSLEGLCAPTGMLVYRKQPSAPLADDDWLLCWYEDQVRELGWGPPPGRAALLEVFCSADHGTVLGYHDEGGEVLPVLAPVSGHLASWGVELARDVIGDVADQVLLDAELVDLDADLRAAVRELMSRLWNNPTPLEAAVWGSFPFEGTSGGDRPTPLARPYALREVLSGFREGGLPSFSWYFWIEASEAVTPAPLRALIRSARWSKQRGAGAVQRLRRAQPSTSAQSPGPT